ncbi:MAG: M14 family zinc carboxypeptidase, partial [Pseudomonadota bacterium]
TKDRERPALPRVPCHVHPTETRPRRVSLTLWFRRHRRGTNEQRSHPLAWVALSYPALPSHTANWVATFAEDPLVTTEVLATTSRGWPVYALFVTDGSVPADRKRGILVYGQEHNNEQDGGWACQGLVDFLTSGDPVATALLENTVFIVLPDIAPDATASGSIVDPDTGRCSHLYNPAALDRLMPGSAVPMPEEAAAVWDRLVAFVDAGGSIDFAINIHQGGYDNFWGMYEGWNTTGAEARAKSFDDRLTDTSTTNYMPVSSAAWVPNARQGYSRGGWQSIDLTAWPSLRLFGRCWEEWRTVPLGYELAVGSKTSPNNFLAEVRGLTYFGEALARTTYDYHGGFAKRITLASPAGRGALLPTAPPTTTPKT